MSNRMESTTSKTPSTAATVEGHPDGLRGVFRTLAQQHREAAALLHRAKTNVGQRRELWPQIRTALLSHERAELREVYAVLRQHEMTRALAYHHDQEAESLEQLIDRLGTTPIDSPAWTQLFAQLAETVIAHATQEELKIFPAAQAAIGEALADALEPKLLATKQQIERAV